MAVAILWITMMMFAISLLKSMNSTTKLFFCLIQFLAINRLKFFPNSEATQSYFAEKKNQQNLLVHLLKTAMHFFGMTVPFTTPLKKTEIGKGILNAFRSDCESKFKFVPEPNSDISYNGYATKPLNEFLNTISQFEQINTDRLHVAITAVLLGKKVNLYPNSYFKNKAVFEYSLSRFPNINFINQDTF